MRVVFRPASGSVKPKAHWSCAGDQPRDPARLLLGRALHHDRMRPEQVDMHRRGRRHRAAVARDLVHHDGRFGDAETRAAVVLRHGDPEPSGLGHRAMEFARENAVLVAREPVVVAELRDDGAHAFADRAQFLLVRQGSRFRSWWRLPPFRWTQASSAPPSDAGCRPSCRRCRACPRPDWRRRPRRSGAHARSPLRTARSSG